MFFVEVPQNKGHSLAKRPFFLQKTDLRALLMPQKCVK
jgi:hypothetical protein